MLPRPAGSESTLVPAVMPPSGRFEVEISFYVRVVVGDRGRVFDRFSTTRASMSRRDS